jgi:hypothetical protein
MVSRKHHPTPRLKHRLQHLPKQLSFPLLVALLAGLPAGPLRADPLPALDSPELAQGPYASMHMLLQKTLLKINVATIDVRVDRQAQGRLAELARDKSYSYALDAQLAPIAIGASRAVVQMQFVRDIPLNRWMGVVRDNLEQAREAGLISREIEQRVGQGIPAWFASLKDRGYQKGDRLIYAVSPDALRTVVVSAGGQVLLDMVERDPGVRRVVLASYFAPKSDSREPLLRSLLETKR